MDGNGGNGNAVITRSRLSVREEGEKEMVADGVAASVMETGEEGGELAGSGCVGGIGPR